jgi:hypothetical protein
MECTHPLVQWVSIGVFSRVWSERDVKLTTYSSSAEFKIEWSDISTHCVCFYAWAGKEPAAMYSIFAHEHVRFLTWVLHLTASFATFAGCIARYSCRWSRQHFEIFDTGYRYCPCTAFWVCSLFHVSVQSITLWKCLFLFVLRIPTLEIWWWPLCSLPSFTAFYTPRCVRYRS